MDEFELIEKLLQPLSGGAQGAFDLTDDGAVIGEDQNMVIVKDALVEGVHFRSDDPPDLIARKCLRVNLSDLAAMGAAPAGYLLACVWGRGWTPEKIETFARGLAADQNEFGVKLFGGDTTAHDGVAMFTVTAFGAAPAMGVLRRSGARVGDDVYVTGTIGDGHLGLKELSGERAALSGPASDYLAARYRLPTPRIGFGQKLVGLASAAIDVSDGVIADAQHIASQSSVRIEINAQSLPLSEAARAHFSRSTQSDVFLAALAAGGDDYELLFTAPPDVEPRIFEAAACVGTPVTKIGRAVVGEGVAFLNARGEAIEHKASGYRHVLTSTGV